MPGSCSLRAVSARPSAPSAGFQDCSPSNGYGECSVKSIVSGQQETAPSMPPAARVGRRDRVEIVETRRAGWCCCAAAPRRPPAGRMLGGELLEERHRRVAALGEHEHAAARLPQAAGQRPHLRVVGEPRGHRDAAVAVVRRRGAGREADRARRACRSSDERLASPRSRPRSRRACGASSPIT